MQALNRNKVISLMLTQLSTIILTTIPYNVTLLYSYTYCYFLILYVFGVAAAMQLAVRQTFNSMIP